jgi:hypothetical protein
MQQLDTGKEIEMERNKKKVKRQIRKFWLSLNTEILFSFRVIAGIILVSFNLSILNAQPQFSKLHGFYYSPFTLEISTSQTGSQVNYTTDGSAPRIDHGTLYTSPVPISATAVIRAVSIYNGQVSKCTTATYIFPDDVIRQPNNPKGYPALWGPYTGINGTAIADYEMDPEMMSDTAFASSVKDALTDLPTISLVTDKGFLFSNSLNPDSGGIYIYTGPPLTNTTNGTGYGWERPVSFELFDSKDSVSLQADCGLRIEGGHSRRPEKNPKHSFRLVFRSKYGPSKLNFPLFGSDAVSEFNTFIIRAGFGNTWTHWSWSERKMAQYLRDRWSKDTHKAMGYVASHGFFVHLYINGIYWGIYNPSERLDKNFAESYLMGSAADIDIIKDYNEVVDGNITAWNKMMAMANTGLSSELAYQKFRGNFIDGTPDPNSPAMVDVVNLTDYMLLNFYGGNWDWDQHNWVAMRNRVNPGGGFRFFCWDEEHMVETVDANILSENNSDCPSRVFQQLLKNESYKRLFADRIQKLCFNGGVLTPASAAGRWIDRAGQIDKAVIAESARWGDYRRDVHPWQTPPYELYTRESHWIPELNFMLNTYFTGRTDAFIASLRSAGLFPVLNAPVLMINGNSVIPKKIASGDILTMSAASSVIYFTTDGSDPVDWQLTPVPSKSAIIYSSQIILESSSHVKARSYRDGKWSATNEQFFVLPSDYNFLKITEISYNPQNFGAIDSKELEFIELKNTGTATINLGGLKFIKGINYSFQPDVAIKPHEFVVLASSPSEFCKKYGFLPYGMYEGQLDNSGEKIVLISKENDTVCSFSYSHDIGWPAKADGEGFTLVPKELDPVNKQDKSEYWRASYFAGGSPGKDDNIIPGERYSELITVFPNYPNPFNEATIFSYMLLLDANVTITIQNSAGEIIKILDEGSQAEGAYRIEWNGKNSNNCPLTSGIYFYRISATNRQGTSMITNKMVVIR